MALSLAERVSRLHPLQVGLSAAKIAAELEAFVQHLDRHVQGMPSATANGLDGFTFFDQDKFARYACIPPHSAACVCTALHTVSLACYVRACITTRCVRLPSG